MTKNVRIENAATSSYRIAVDVIESRLVDGQMVDTVVETKILVNPADLMTFTLGWNGRKLVVRES